MKRREFLTTLAGFGLLTLIPKSIFANNSATSTKNKLKDRTFVFNPYDDNKVVRVYEPMVTNYDYSENLVFWKTIDPKVLRKMLGKSIAEISGETSEVKAWKMIFAVNKMADLSAKKVVVKVNFNNTGRDIHTTLNNSPAMMAVLAQSMLTSGLKEENILFFDCSRPFPDEFKTEVRSLGLSKVGMKGKTDDLPESDKTIFLSDNKGLLRDGKQRENYPIPQCLIDADYMVNLHLVKMHETGVTGSMKNLFGISKNVAHYMHWIPKSFKETYHLPDISLNEEIKKRARLNIAEFIFGGHTPDSIDKFTNEAFFPDGKPASLIVSRSPFYHDTVLYGFIKNEHEACDPEKIRKDLKIIGPDTWLKKSAERYSGWKYDQASILETNKNGRPKKDLSFKNVNYVSI